MSTDTRNKRMQPGRLAVIGGFLALGTLAMGGAQDVADEASYVAGPDSVVSLELAFITHLDANLPEQDAYIERVPGSGKVWRVTVGDNDMSAELYRTATPTKHDPFNEDALGPYDAGEPLGITLGEWLAQRGTGNYTCSNGEANLDLSFTGLVANGVYTIWHAFMAMPPTTPFSGTLDLPLGARDGSESVFRANADGTGKFQRTFSPCLQMSDVWTTALLALNYHSDGNTWQAHPGEFGYNAHIPLFLMLPNREGI